MGKKKIIIDTNVLISAFGWEGKPKQIFERVLDEEFELIVSEKQLVEFKRVLEYPRLGFSDEQKAKFVEILLSIASIVETATSFNVIKEDPPDNMFLEAAFETEANFIISGNKHVLNVGKFGKTKIVKPAEFLELVN